MVRSATILLALLVAGCAAQVPSTFNTGQPGVDVARAAMTAGAPEIALNISNSVLEKDAGNLAALLGQGDALSALGRFDEAETSYTKALVVAPASTDAKIGLGRLRLATEPAQAQLLFVAVLERDPRNKVALNNLGIAYDLQGNPASAQRAYRQALGVDPGLRAAEVNLALSMALNGRAAQAVQILQPLAGRADASRRLRHDLAVALMMAGDRQEAARILGVDMTPDEVERALRDYGDLGP